MLQAWGQMWMGLSYTARRLDAGPQADNPQVNNGNCEMPTFKKWVEGKASQAGARKKSGDAEKQGYVEASSSVGFTCKIHQYREVLELWGDSTGTALKDLPVKGSRLDHQQSGPSCAMIKREKRGAGSRRTFLSTCYHAQGYRF